MKKIISLGLLSGIVFLAGCNNQALTPNLVNQSKNLQEVNNSQLVITANLPENIKEEMLKAYGTLPQEIKPSKGKVIFFFQASDGKEYVSSDEVELKTGKIVKNGSVRTLKLNDGREFAFPGEQQDSSVVSPLALTCPQCGFAFTGPYYRSWSNSGYKFITANLAINNLTLPAPIGGKKWAAFTYMGFQSNYATSDNSQFEVDAGLTYQDGLLSMFVNNNGAYTTLTGGKLLLTGNPYKTNIFLADTNSWGISYQYGDATIIGKNYYGAGINIYGNNVTFKRMMSLANNYYGDPKNGRVPFSSTTYAQAKMTGYISDTHLGKYLGVINNIPNVQDSQWSSQIGINSNECKSPRSSAIIMESGNTTSDSLKVTIDTSK